MIAEYLARVGNLRRKDILITNVETSLDSSVFAYPFARQGNGKFGSEANEADRCPFISGSLLNLP